MLTLNARSYTPIDDAFCPTGEIAPVMGTPLDFTAPTPIGLRAGDDFEQLTLAGGYDHNFVLDRTDTISLELAANLAHPGKRWLLEVHTTEPGLQLYSGNFLDGSLAGPTGHPYDVRSGLRSRRSTSRIHRTTRTSPRPYCGREPFSPPPRSTASESAPTVSLIPPRRDEPS